jgi:hypothetical protein
MRIRINISFSTRIPIFGSGTEIDVLFADLDPDPVMLPPTDLKICFFSLGTTTTRIRKVHSMILSIFHYLLYTLSTVVLFDLYCIIITVCQEEAILYRGIDKL